MAGYLGTKAVFLSTTAASVVGNSTIGGDLTVDTDTLYVDSTNNYVGVGTASPSNPFQVGTSDLIVDSSGRVGIGTTAPTSRLEIRDEADISMNASGTGHLEIDGNGYNFAIALDADGANVYTNSSSRDLIFGTNETERMRIDGSGRLLVGTTDTALYNNTSGNGFIYDAVTGSTQVTRNGGSTLYINRSANDGGLVEFFQNGTSEGSISVSGTTVSYNGGHLSRWSRLPDGTDDSNIFKGTVMTNLNEMVVWETEEVPATYWEEGDELPEGVSVGDIKTEAIPAGTEDNEQLNYTTVSSVEGDANVAGIFVAWDDSDEWGDYYLAQTGDLIIRIAAGTVVNRGDLLMSAGDGTAKPQEDDIVRSKTIAKVTSTEVTYTYADGSYCVPCVVMGC